MTNDQRLKEIEAAVNRIEGMLTKMAKPAVWNHDVDHMTEEEKADWAKKLSESLENNSMPIVPMDVPATASQVAELKAMVKELMDTKASDEKAVEGYDVWRVPLGQVDPADDSSQTNMECAVTLVKELQDGGLKRPILLVPQVYYRGPDGPIDAGWKFESVNGSRPSEVVADNQDVVTCREETRIGASGAIIEGVVLKIPGSPPQFLPKGGVGKIDPETGKVVYDAPDKVDPPA